MVLDGCRSFLLLVTTRNSSVVYRKAKNSLGAKICMISNFNLLLHIMKSNLKRINSFVISILLTSCENQQISCMLFCSFQC